MQRWRGPYSGVGDRVQAMISQESSDSRLGAKSARRDRTASALPSGAALNAWRNYRRSHTVVVRQLDARLHTGQAITGHAYEALRCLAQAENGKLPMSVLSDRLALTPSGGTRLVRRLASQGFVERVPCGDDARIAYAKITDAGLAKLADAEQDYTTEVNRLFVERFSEAELHALSRLLGRLSGARG